MKQKAIDGHGAYLKNEIIEDPGHIVQATSSTGVLDLTLAGNGKSLVILSYYRGVLY